MVHTTLEMMTLEDHAIQIVIGMPVESPQHCYSSQIEAHTKYTLL
jgi:hypothetical protein